MNFFLLALFMALPHILYYFIWTQPKKWMELCNKHAKGQHPSDVMMKVAWGLKAVQFTSYFFFYIGLGETKLGEITALRFVAFLICFGVGQALNAGIYNAIGNHGVYYGTRLGVEVPWYNGFPFTVCPHPQYIGSVLSYYGLAFLLHNAEHHMALWGVAVLMTGYYAVTGYIEEKM